MNLPAWVRMRIVVDTLEGLPSGTVSNHYAPLRIPMAPNRAPFPRRSVRPRAAPDPLKRSVIAFGQDHLRFPARTGRVAGALSGPQPSGQRRLWSAGHRRRPPADWGIGGRVGRGPGSRQGPAFVSGPLDPVWGPRPPSRLHPCGGGREGGHLNSRAVGARPRGQL
jgi:hypothetical protein